MKHLDCQECNSNIDDRTTLKNKKILYHTYSIRLWYLFCPLFALVLAFYHLQFLLHLYEGALILFSFICISSQFFTSINWGIDWEQYRLKKEAKLKAKKELGVFYTSPLWLCLPCILVVAVIELPKLINYIFS